MVAERSDDRVHRHRARRAAAMARRRPHRRGPAALRLGPAAARPGGARPLAPPPLSGVTGAPCDWLPDARGLVCRTIVPDLKPLSAAPSAPTGPIVQENLGRKKPAPTNPELLS